MAASKLKNRRRFITREAQLDIPEDKELTLPSADGDSGLAPSEDGGLLDRTWPRRTWRPGNDVVPSFGLHSSTFQSTSAFPRFNPAFHGNESQATPTTEQPSPSVDRSPTLHPSPTSSGNRWSFRSLSDAVTSACLSATSSPSETISEPCFASNCYEDAGHASKFLSPQINHPQPVAGSAPELVDSKDDNTTPSLETKRRSHSLNDSYVHPFSYSSHGNRFLRPGSVLHRARTWELAGKNQPFHVVVSPITNHHRAAQLNSWSQASSEPRRVDQSITRPKTMVEPSENVCPSMVLGEIPSDSGSPVAKATAFIPTDSGKYSPFSNDDRIWQYNPELKLGHPKQTSPMYNAQLSVPGYDTNSNAFRRSFDMGKSKLQTFGSNANISGTELHNNGLSPAQNDCLSPGSFSLTPGLTDTLSNTAKALSCDIHEPKPTISEPVSRGSPTYERYLTDNDRLVSQNTSWLQTQRQKPSRSKSLRLFNPDATFSTSASKGTTDYAPQPADSFSNPTSHCHFKPTNVDSEQHLVALPILSKPSLSMIALNNQISKPDDNVLKKNPTLHTNSLARPSGSFLGKSASDDRLNSNIYRPSYSAETANGANMTNGISSSRGVPSDDPKTQAFRNIGPNFVVKKLTTLSKTPFLSPSFSEANRKSGNETTATVPDLSPEIKKFGSQCNDFQQPKRSEIEDSTRRRFLPTFGDLERPGIGKLQLSNSKTSAFKPVCPAAIFRQENTATAPNLEQFTSSTDLMLQSSPVDPVPASVVGQSYDWISEVKEQSPTVEHQTKEENVQGSQFDRNAVTSGLNGEPPSRHIRVVLKSSSQLKDETRRVEEPYKEEQKFESASPTDTSQNFSTLVANADFGMFDEKRIVTIDKPEMSFAPNESQKIKDKLSPRPQENRQPAAGFVDLSLYSNERALDSLNQQKLSSIPAAVTERNDIKRNTISNFSPASVVDAACMSAKQAENGENRCIVEIKETESAAKKPFEIIKKKLIIPEPISWFGVKPDEKYERDKTTVKLTDNAVSMDFRDDLQKPGYPSNGKNGRTLSDAAPVLCTDNARRADRRKSDSSSSRRSASDVCLFSNPALGVSSPNRYEFDCGYRVGAQHRPGDLDSALKRIEYDMGIIANAKTPVYSGKHKETIISGSDSLGRRSTIRPESATDSARKDAGMTAFRFRDDGGKMAAQKQEQEASFKADSNYVNTSFAACGAEFPSDVNCSITTELDKAIEMLTSTRQSEADKTKSEQRTTVDVPCTFSAASSRTFSATTVPNLFGSPGNLRVDSKSADPETATRAVTLQMQVSPGNHDDSISRDRSVVSNATGNFGRPPVDLHSPSSSSFTAITPIPVVRITPNVVRPDPASKLDAMEKRSKWMLQLAREDSFNRPDSPLFHETLPLPKDSVIMRHRMHKKELGYEGLGGGGGAGGGCGGASICSSSSESSEDDSPVMRTAPRRTKKLKNVQSIREPLMTTTAAVAAIDAGGDSETDDRTEERDSIFSSTTSIRPVSLDSSFVSEDNLE